MWTALIDTSVYIGHWERGLYADRLDEVRGAFVVRHSAVVLLGASPRGANPSGREDGRPAAPAGLDDLAAHGGGLVGGWADHPDCG